MGLNRGCLSSVTTQAVLSLATAASEQNRSNSEGPGRGRGEVAVALVCGRVVPPSEACQAGDRSSPGGSIVRSPRGGAGAAGGIFRRLGWLNLLGIAKEGQSGRASERYRLYIYCLYYLYPRSIEPYTIGLSLILKEVGSGDPYSTNRTSM